jgi:cyanophycin synthetase
MRKNSAIIKKAIEEIGGSFERIIPERSFFYIKIKGQKIFINRKFVIDSNLYSRKETTNFKDLTYVLLTKEHIPTPETVSFYKKTIDKISIENKLKDIKFPIIVKDAKGSLSKGVFVNIKDIKTAKSLILKEIKKYPCLVAQEMVFGKEYRVLILDKKAIGVLEMIPPYIVGDGKKTTRELIKTKQKNTKEKTPFDEALNELLFEQAENLSSVPIKGRKVFIKINSCLAQGGETKDVTDIIHKDIESLCVRVAKIVEKKLAGLDIICEDITKSPLEQNFYIIEANRRPDLYIHYDPTYGKTRNVIKDIIEFILKIKKSEDSLI